MLLEKGPAHPFFESMGFDGDEEHGFCQFLRRPEVLRGNNGQTAEELYEAHRRRHVTEATIIDIKGMGLNAVRVNI